MLSPGFGSQILRTLFQISRGFQPHRNLNLHTTLRSASISLIRRRYPSRRFVRNLEEMETSCKRMRKAAEESNGEGGGGGELAAAAVGGGGGGGGVEEEEAVEETNEGAVASEEMEAKIQAIFERIESFTQQVSDMLETGKAMLSNLSQQFEERLIAIHKDQVGKWQDEIKELRSLDASNSATHSLLRSAQFHLFQSVTEEHSRRTHTDQDTLFFRL